MVKLGYKQTEIGVIPEDWDLILFEDCFSVLSNNTLSRAELNYNGGELQNIHYGDILVKFSAVTDCGAERLPYVNAELVKKVSKGFLRDGDIVIADTAEDNTVGKATEVVAVNGNKVVSGLHTIPCRAKDDKMFVPMWLGYFINHNTYHNQLLPYITGIKVSSISKSAIAGTMIAVPKPDEQTKIVAALSDIDALITNLEKLIAKKKAIKQGAMQELLTGNKRLSGFIDPWAKHMVKDLGVFYSGLSGKGKSDFGCGTAHYITFLNVLTNTKININALERVRVSEGESQNTVKKGDLFFNTSSETPEEVGMCAALLDDVENTYLNSFCFGLRITNPEMYPLFLSYYFNSQEGRQIMKVLAQGATRYNLSKTNFSETIITVPDKEEQIAIAHLLLDMDVEIDTLFAKLEKARNMKKGMMSELLTGRIRLV